MAVSVGIGAPVRTSAGVAVSEAGAQAQRVRDKPMVRTTIRISFKQTSFCDGIHKLFYSILLWKQVIYIMSTYQLPLLVIITPAENKKPQRFAVVAF